MTTQEHLQRIHIKCAALISAWEGEKFQPSNAMAGWRATIAAIETLLAMQFSDKLMNTRTSHIESGVAAILAAWPEETLL